MAMSGSPFAMGGNTPFGNIPASIPGFAQSFFGNSGQPYQDAQRAYKPYYNEAKGYQNPFYQAGQNAIPQYQEWLQGQKDPSAFINKLMGGYQESPWARYQQEQARRAGLNAASAGGLSNGMGGAGVGSTPYLLQAQQNASDISSQDMQKWLANVLGINTQYGEGQNRMMGYGQHAGDQLSEIAQNGGMVNANNAYGRSQGENYDRMAGWQAIGKLFGG